MEKRRVNYARISLILVVLIIAIFGVDFVIRSVKESKQSPSADMSNASYATPASGLESIGSETAATTSTTLSTEDVSISTISDGSETTTSQAQLPTTQNNYNIDSSLYYTLEYSSNDMKYGSLVLANSSNPYYKDVSANVSYFYDFKNDLYTLGTDSIQLMSEPIQQLNSMFSDFNTLYGISNMCVLSGYSTALSNECALDHSTGYSIDLASSNNGTNTPLTADGDYNWVFQNSYKYGFIQRYPADKESETGLSEQVNHFRYVGIPHSYIMHDNNLSLEGYITYLKNYTFDAEHLTTTIYSYDYEIYFIPSEGETTKVPVPIDKYYVVSGNNVDGFVVVIQTQSSNSVVPSEEVQQDEYTEQTTTTQQQW